MHNSVLVLLNGALDSRVVIATLGDGTCQYSIADVMKYEANARFLADVELLVEQLDKAELHGDIRIGTLLNTSRMRQP